MTILFAWNPDRFTWGDLEDELAQSRSGKSVENSWSVGNRRHIAIGARFFMIRLGSEPRGIMASGRTASEPYVASHWVRERAAAGHQARYVDVVFDYLSEKPAIAYSELQNPPLNKFHWSIQMSGVNLPNEVARPLEVLWRERTGSEHRGRPEEYESTVGLNEGSVSRVYVNRYERNPRARSICLDHHDPVCAVCAQRMSEIYQGVPDELIHVHHIIPISMIREEYRIDPIKQMVPVCPNCHAVIHSQSPPLTIDEVRKRRREQK